MSTQIKTHRQGASYNQPHFFILNKGLNSGKPLRHSCPNCFVFMSQSDEESEFFFWLLFGLWRSKAFYPYLKGSVIPYISLNDLKTSIQKSHSLAKIDDSAFQKSVSAMRTLDELEKQYHRNLRLIDDARRSIFQKFIRHK